MSVTSLGIDGVMDAHYERLARLLHAEGGLIAVFLKLTGPSRRGVWVGCRSVECRRQVYKYSVGEGSKRF
jgi:hypothetical protein